jgi:peptidyl-prolyl cis-trans isomerase D
MFELIEKNKRIAQLILALIMLPFALWGISSYTRSRSSADAVAKVGGITITQQDFENALRQQQDRMREQLGANYDASMFDSPDIRRAVLENMVSHALLVERARAAGIAVPDDQVAQVISGIEAFQQGGRFDKNRYEALLRGQGMSPLLFEARVRDDLLGKQLQDTFLRNGYAPRSTVDNLIRLNEQQRTVSISPVSYQAFVPQVKVADSDIRKYYDENKAEFQVQEQARVDFVKLSADDLTSKAEVSDEEARKYYDEHQNEFGTPEERRAAHILIAVKANASQAESDAAKSRAEDLLQQVSKNPASFADLARKYSQDPGSAANGGDLGFFGRGMMVKPFEDAVYALSVGQVSGLVKSDFGYHVIKLIAIKPSRISPFDEVRDGIRSKLRQQKAADMFAELAEKFSNTVYEQSDTLKPAADLVASKIEHSGWLTKGASAVAPWTPKMLQAIFSDDSIRNKRNTDAIDVAPNTLVAARVVEYKPASVRAFGEVQEQIRQKLVREQALDLAVRQGTSLLAQLQAGGSTTLKWGSEQVVTRSEHGSLDMALVREIFRAGAAKLPQFVGAEDPRNGYLLVRVDAVKDGVLDDAKRARYVQQLEKLSGDELFKSYLADARQQASIKLNLPGNPSQP